MADESYTAVFLRETREVVAQFDLEAIEAVVAVIAALKDRGGRLFILGSGGGAGHASHAVNDFRKILGIESYSPSDNVSELTARINDEGWDTAYSAWLTVSRISEDDGLLVFSVGGGDRERNVSPNLVNAMDVARVAGASICAIVGRDGGHAARVADACVIIPTADEARVTPHVEGLQAVIWHLIVSHPALSPAPTRWESVVGRSVG